MAGVYAEAVRVEKAGLRIEGRPDPDGEPVNIENPGGAALGFNVRPGSDHLTLGKLAAVNGRPVYASRSSHPSTGCLDRIREGRRLV